jgi:group I intron endonuclease
MGTIYLITCLITGKYYVGQTTWPLIQRWSGHKTAAKNGKLKGHLQSAINKYGSENFVIETLTEAPQEQLNNFEQLWIWALDSQRTGMNLTGGGDGAGTLSDEQRAAISRRMKGNQHGAGKTWTPSQRARCGKKTPEQTEAMRQMMTGNTFRKGLSSWNKGKSGYKVGSYNVRPGELNPFFGRKHTEKSKAAMRVAKLGKPAWNRKEGERWPSGRLKKSK